MVLSEIIINDNPFVHIKYMIIYVNHNLQLTRETIECSYSKPKNSLLLNILPEIVEIIIIILELNHTFSEKTFKIQVTSTYKPETTPDTNELRETDELNNKMELITKLFSANHTSHTSHTTHNEMLDTMENMGSGLSKLINMSKDTMNVDTSNTSNGGTQLNLNKIEKNAYGMIIKKKT